MIESIFTSIYDRKRWGGGSGPGSHPSHCHEYTAWLQGFVHQHRGALILDLGCGDWQSTQLIDWSGVEYVGADVVRSVIDRNHQRYATSNVHFLHADVLAMSDLDAFDAVIVKDVLQHLSFATISKVLRAIDPIPTWLITNGVPRDGINRDCADGRYRPLAMLSVPFNLPGESVLHFGEITALEHGKELVKVAR